MRLILEAKYEDDLLCRQCFAETAKKKKNGDTSPRGVFTTQSNIYDGAFL